MGYGLKGQIAVKGAAESGTVQCLQSEKYSLFQLKSRSQNSLWNAEGQKSSDGRCVRKDFWSSCKIPQNKNPFRIEKNPLFKPQGFPLFFCEMPMVIWELPIRSAQHFSIPKGMKSDQYEGIEMTPSILNHFNVSNAFNFVNFSVRKSTRQNCWIGLPDKFSFLKI